MTALLEKHCSKCGITKSIDQFFKDKRSLDGLYCQCKNCKNKSVTKSRQANPVIVQTASMVHEARKRAKDKSLPFDIDRDYIRSIVPSHCPVFKCPLEWSSHRNQNSAPLPNSPSLDRIDPSKGYVKDNVWIISHRANAIKNNASHEELKLVTEAVGRAIVDSLDW